MDDRLRGPTVAFYLPYKYLLSAPYQNLPFFCLPSFLPAHYIHSQRGTNGLGSREIAGFFFFQIYFLFFSLSPMYWWAMRLMGNIFSLFPSFYFLFCICGCIYLFLFFLCSFLFFNPQKKGTQHQRRLGDRATGVRRLCTLHLTCVYRIYICMYIVYI